MFGDRRQLYPWELVRPALEDAPVSPTTSRLPFDATGSFSSDGRSDAKLDLQDSPDPSFQTHHRSRSTGSGSFDFSDLGFAHVPSILLSPSIASRDKDTLYFAPEHLAPKLKRSSPTFASLTKIFEPLVIESQREIVFRGAAYALITTALACAIAFSVPNKH